MAPFDQLAYERINKETNAAPWPWKMFTFTLLVVAAMVLVYFGLRFGYGPYLESRISNLDSELSELGQSIPESEQENFISFYSQLVNVRTLLDKHVMTSAVFPILEKNTHTGIFYTNLDLNLAEQRATLEGISRSYETLAQQLVMLDKVGGIDRYLITESQAIDGRVRFRLNIFFKPAVFGL